MLKIDPRTVKVVPPGDTTPTVLTLSTASAPAAAPSASASGSASAHAHAAPKEPTVKPDTQLWLSTGSFAIGPTSPGPGAVALFGGESSPAAIAGATTLAGVTDEDGTLVVVFADAPGDGAALRALLQQLGCSMVIVPPHTLDVRLGGSLDLGGDLAKTALVGPIVTLGRAQAPAARELFPNTPVVDPSVWQPLQSRRVRYFGKKPVRPGVPSGTLGGTGGTGSATPPKSSAP